VEEYGAEKVVYSYNKEQFDDSFKKYVHGIEYLS
jgi:hypothetical protein